MGNTSISICLSDLPKEKMTTAENGKKYINLVLWERKKPDKYGNTHFLAVSKGKEDKDAKTIFCGNGKTIEPKPNIVTVADVSNNEEDDQLPF